MRMTTRAGSTTITVTRIDQNTAKKVHKQLTAGRGFTVQIRCSEGEFYDRFQQLTAKVAKCTDYGLDIFPICMYPSTYYGVSDGRHPVSAGKYMAFEITNKDCEEYNYGIRFAKREFNDFKKYIGKALKGAEKSYEQLQNTNLDFGMTAESLKAQTDKAKQTLKQLRELNKYLTKTKFRNLSEAMRARILLEVAGKSWGKTSMRYSSSGHARITFKSLYQRNAQGVCAWYAQLTCKMCAAFHIGDYNYLEGILVGEDHAVTQIKVKTLGGKTRYAILSNGNISTSYNHYAGYTARLVPDVYKHHRVSYTLTKINQKKQQLKHIIITSGNRSMTHIVDGEIVSSNSLTIYKFDLSRSEW